MFLLIATCKKEGTLPSTFFSDEYFESIAMDVNQPLRKQNSVAIFKCIHKERYAIPNSALPITEIDPTKSPMKLFGALYREF